MENQNNDTVKFNNHQRLIIIILAVILIIGAGLRFYKLGSNDLWGDEYRMRSYTGYSYSILWNNTIIDGGNLSYPSMVQKFLFELFPETEFYMRLPTALLSIFSILSLYLMGKTLYDARTGIAAAFLLTFSLFHIFMAQENKLAYMTTTAFYPLIIYSLFKEMEKAQNRNWLIFIISVLSLLYVHFLTIPAVFSVVALICLLFIFFLVKPSAYWQNISGCALSYRFFLNLAISLIIIFAAYLPVLSAFKELLTGPFGYAMSNSSYRPFRETVNIAFFLNLFKGYSGSDILFIIFASMVVFCLITSLKNQKEMLTGGFLFLCISIPFLAYWIFNTNVPLSSKYFIYILPIYILIAAKGIISFVDLFFKKWPIQNQARFYIIILLVAGINLFTYKPLWAYYRNERNNHSDASVYLLNNIKNGDIIFFSLEQYDHIEGLLYYMDKFGKDIVFIDPYYMQYFPFPPNFFRPMDKRDLVTPDSRKKQVFLIYSGEKDEEVKHWIKKLPYGNRFWIISSKEKLGNPGADVEKRQYSQDEGVSDVYSNMLLSILPSFPQHKEILFIYFGQR